VWLHAVIAIAAAYFGFAGRREGVADAPSMTTTTTAP
jgi:hypothetical protein